MQITETSGATALFSSKVLLQQAKEYQESLETLTDSKALIKHILDEFVALTKYYTAIGDQEYRNFKNAGNSDFNEIYLLNYGIPEQFKDLAILHRDALLQLQIASYKHLDNTVSSEKLEKHFEQTKTLLVTATEDFNSIVIDERTAMYKSAKRGNKLLAGIKHQTNPWDVYKAQFETLQTQLKDIAGNNTAITRTLKTFKDIEKQKTTFLDEIVADSEALKKLLGEVISSVKKLESTNEISELLLWIDGAVKKTSKETNLQLEYTDTLELKLKALSEQTIPVGVEGGLLLTKKLDFNKAVKKWIDFEVLPLLIDVLEHKSNMQSYFKHSLLNLKSSLLIEKNNNALDVMPSQLQTLQNVHYTIASNGTKMKELVTEIETKFTTDFQFSKVFTQEDFLEVSLQSSLSNFTSGKNSIFSGLKQKLNNRFSKINSKYERTTRFSEQNKVEDTIHCINYRMFKEDNAHYDTLFLNKNFIGDLFLLSRTEQKETIDKSVAQWKNGFNKALLVTGDALSGKSTFAEYVGQKHFKKHMVYLEKDSVVTFGGRKFNTTKNLKEALQHIKKGFSGERPLLIIDALELWRDDVTSLLENTRALLAFIASESDNVLVLVTTSKQMQSHLDKRLRFTEAFSTTINLNKATFEEIYKAVMLRHGASHKQLVSSKSEPLTTKQIEQFVFKLSRKLNYNIGEVLQAWTYGTTVVDDNNVIYEDKDIGFKDFFNSEEAIILKYVLLYKSISEKELKQFLGTSFENGYNSSLKRLTNTKVLLRDTGGVLKLNPVVAMDVKQILIYRGLIN